MSRAPTPEELTHDQLRRQRDSLAEAARILLATHPVFRSKPIGAEGSMARLQQRDQMEAEDALRSLLETVE